MYFNNGIRRKLAENCRRKMRDDRRQTDFCRRCSRVQVGDSHRRTIRRKQKPKYFFTKTVKKDYIHVFQLRKDPLSLKIPTRTADWFAEVPFAGVARLPAVLHEQRRLLI